jgi:hypothetical protein
LYIRTLTGNQFIGFWLKLYVIHNDNNNNRGFTRLSITKNTIDTLNVYLEIMLTVIVTPELVN